MRGDRDGVGARKQRMGEGDDLGHGRVKKDKNMKEKKREMALQHLRCVFCPDLKS